jgi:GNAT superfamily N-acetyltransferase
LSTTDPILVRPLRKSDLPELELLCKRHALLEKADWTSDEDRILRWEKQFFDDPPVVWAWVSLACGRMNGYVTVTLEYSTWGACYYAHVDCLYVCEHHRGMGIGRQLMAEVMQFAKTRRVSRVEWQSPVWNELATKFYESLDATWKLKRRFAVLMESEDENEEAG